MRAGFARTQLDANAAQLHLSIDPAEHAQRAALATLALTLPHAEIARAKPAPLRAGC